MLDSDRSLRISLCGNMILFMRTCKIVSFEIVAAVGLTVGFVQAATRHTPMAYPAVAKPWRDVDLSFSRPGRIVKILVHRGQLVELGQLLAQENDRQQKIAAQLAGISADSTLRVQAAQAELAQDRVSLRRTQWAAGQKAATSFEVQRAELKVTIDQLSLKLAQLKHRHDQLTWQAAELAVRRRQIKAPFSGIIENRFTNAGSSINAFKKVLSLVQVDALKIFVPVPLPLAVTLHLGQSARVTAAAARAMRGKIIWIARVADSASNTLMVEIRVINRNHIPAGQQVNVTFITEKQAAESMNANPVARRNTHLVLSDQPMEKTHQ